MIKKFEIFEIEYCESDLEYIDILTNYLKENYKEIMEFFEIKNYDKNIKIKIWDSKESYRNYFNEKYKRTVSPWSIGGTNYIDKHPRIDLISYKKSLECKGHQNDTLDDFIEVVLHEFVHVCHLLYNKEPIKVTWFSEGLATNLSHQSKYINHPLTLNASLDEIMNKIVPYYNYYAMVNYMLNNYSREEILEFVKNKELLIQETPEIYIKTKEYVKNKKIEQYLSQDTNNPKYLFHGSPKKLEKISPKLSHDSKNNIDNIDKCIFLFPSFIKSTAYSFKDTIKKNSEGLNWYFEIPNNDEMPVMAMTNVNVDDNIVGYIYVFKKRDNMIKDNNSLQYKCYEELTPDDIIEVKYSDYKQFYSITNNEKKR